MRFTSKLNDIVAVENTEATFKCSITPADVSVKWCRNSVPLLSGPKYKIAHGGNSHSLTITSISQKDAGEISVDAEGKISKATLQVQRKFMDICGILFALSHLLFYLIYLKNTTYNKMSMLYYIVILIEISIFIELPVTFKKKLQDFTVQEQNEVRLEVELSRPSSEVKWMKNGVVLQPGDNVDIIVEGARQTLLFKNVTQGDRGHYSCETLDDKTQAKLTVERKSNFHWAVSIL